MDNNLLESARSQAAKSVVEFYGQSRWSKQDCV